MARIEIDSDELYTRIKNYLSCRDINDCAGGRSIPILHSIDYMAKELTIEISKSNKEYYDVDSFRSLA